MSSSLKMQLACIKLKLVKIMKRQLHIIHSLLNPFHNDRGTVNNHIHSSQKMFGVGEFWLKPRVIIKILTHTCYPKNFD